MSMKLGMGLWLGIAVVMTVVGCSTPTGLSVSGGSDLGQQQGFDGAIPDIATRMFETPRHFSQPTQGVRCADMQCLFGTVCVIGFDEEDFVGTCQSAMMQREALACDGPEDCTVAGQVCQGTITDPGGVIYTSRCATLSFEKRWNLCHSDEDCFGGAICRADVGGGAGVGHCE